MRPEVVHNSASYMANPTFDQGWSDADRGQANQGHADVASTPSRRRDERLESHNLNNLESDNNTGQVATVRGRQAGGARDDKDSNKPALSTPFVAINEQASLWKIPSSWRSRSQITSTIGH